MMSDYGKPQMDHTHQVSLILSELEVAMFYDERLRKASDGPCSLGKLNP